MDAEVTSAAVPDGFAPFKRGGPFADRIGPFYFRERQGGGYRYAFQSGEVHGNVNGVIHGGALYSFADQVTGHAVVYATRRLCATIRFKVEYLSPGPIGGLIEAEVDLVGVTRTLVFLRLRVMAGHRTLMTADGTYKLFEPYEPGSRGRAGGTAVDGEPAAPPPPPDGYRPFPMQSEFARICGPVHYKRLPDGRFVNGFWTRAEHDNTSRVAHGGVLYTFADDFMGRTASAKGRRYTATVAMSVEYLAPGPLDTWLEGHAEVTGVDGDFAFVRGRVVHGERLILTADGIWRLLHPYVKPTGPKEDEE